MLTRNNQRTVRQAIGSLGWVDEIVVVDSGSEDGTLETVREFGARVIERPWPGFREQYQFAAEACRNEWALFIDADEVIPPALAEEMQDRLRRNAARPEGNGTAGYVAPRKTWYVDRWIRHGAWASDREIRLYRRDCGAWKGGLHACIHVDGKTETLRNPYLHYTYEDIADHVDTVNRYSSTGADEMADKGRRTSALRAVAGGLARFARDYLLKRGFLDGYPGLVIAVSSAYGAFLKHAKLHERRLQAETPKR
jgi:glycosyltransferase involved in cell wall biosynthesis